MVCQFASTGGKPLGVPGTPKGGRYLGHRPRVPNPVRHVVASVVDHIGVAILQTTRLVPRRRRALKAQPVAVSRIGAVVCVQPVHIADHRRIVVLEVAPFAGEQPQSVRDEDACIGPSRHAALVVAPSSRRRNGRKGPVLELAVAHVCAELLEKGGCVRSKQRCGDKRLRVARPALPLVPLRTVRGC